MNKKMKQVIFAVFLIMLLVTLPFKAIHLTREISKQDKIQEYITSSPVYDDCSDEERVALVKWQQRVAESKGIASSSEEKLTYAVKLTLFEVGVVILTYVGLCCAAFGIDKYNRGSSDYLGYITFKRFHLKTDITQPVYDFGNTFEVAYLTASDLLFVSGIISVIGIILMYFSY